MACACTWGLCCVYGDPLFNCANVQMGGTVHDLEEAELCYAPQYGSAKDPINIAGGWMGWVAVHELRPVRVVLAMWLVRARASSTLRVGNGVHIEGWGVVG